MFMAARRGERLTREQRGQATRGVVHARPCMLVIAQIEPPTLYETDQAVQRAECEHQIGGGLGATAGAQQLAEAVHQRSFEP